MAQCLSQAERELAWKARLSPFSPAVEYVWTALSCEGSPTAGVAVCAAVLVPLW